MDMDEYDPLLAANEDEASAGDAVPTPAKAPAADDKASEVPKEKESEGQSSPSEETKKMVREDGCSSTAPKQLDAQTAAAEEGGALGPAVQVGQAVAQAMEGSGSSGIKEGTEVAEDEAAKQQPVVEKSETAPASAEGAASNKQEFAVEQKVNGASGVALKKAAASEGSGDDDMSLDSSVEAAKTEAKAERGSEEKGGSSSRGRERPRVPDPVEAEQMEKARIRAWERDQQRRRRSREGHAGPHDQEWREYWSRQQDAERGEGSSLSSPGSESKRKKGARGERSRSREREQHGGGRSRWDRDRDWRENGYERAMNESARSPASPPPLGKSQGTSEAGGSHVSSAERAGAFEPEDSERRGSTSSRSSSSRSRSSERRRERRKKRSRREEERGGHGDDDDGESRDRKRKRRSRRRSGSRSRRHHGKHNRKDRDGRKSSRRTRSPSLVCSPPPASIEGGGAAGGGGGDGYEPEQLSAFPEPPPVPADWNGQSTGAAPRDPKQASLSEKQRAFFKEVSKVVKKVLKKYLAKEQIGTKEEMENLTRKMSHKILQKEHGNTKMTKETPVKIAKYIKGYFDKHGFYGVRPTA